MTFPIYKVHQLYSPFKIAKNTFNKTQKINNKKIHLYIKKLKNLDKANKILKLFLLKNNTKMEENIKDMYFMGKKMDLESSNIKMEVIMKECGETML